MHLAVIDSRLLVRALLYPKRSPAKLLALFAYGSVCQDASGQLSEEVDALERLASSVSVPLSQLASPREQAERMSEEAKLRKALMEEALEQHVAGDLLLVTSAPLRAELISLAQEVQGQGHQHVEPHAVNRQIARWTAKTTGALGPTPPYFGAGGKSDRGYLIHTAVIGEAESLITDDKALGLPGDLAHKDPKTRRSVRPYSLDEFVTEVLPYNLDFDAIDAPAVFRAGVRPLSKR